MQLAASVGAHVRGPACITRQAIPLALILVRLLSEPLSRLMLLRPTSLARLVPHAPRGFEQRANDLVGIVFRLDGVRHYCSMAGYRRISMTLSDAASKYIGDAVIPAERNVG